MKAPTTYQIATAEPVGIIRDRVNYVVSSAPAELVGWLGAHAADPDDWQFFYEGDADPDDYEIVRPVYAPVADDPTINKVTPCRCPRPYAA